MLYIYPPGCPPFVCGKVGKIHFPFANDTSPDCGLLILHDCGDPRQMKTPKIELERNGTLYDVETISQANSIQIKDPLLQSVLDSNSCESLKNWTLPSPISPFISFQRVSGNLTLFKCDRALNITPPTGFDRTNCSIYDIYYSPHYNLTPSPPKCPIIQLPLNSQNKGSNDLFRLLSAEIILEVRVTRDCRECYIKGGQCKTDNKGKYYCTKGTKGKLHDGREVAVKRLYEHNYRRLEQFLNEVKILTRLHHKNLVSLYGCTSRHSRELLLVYEFVPNGTVADHIHGDRATPGSLKWATQYHQYYQLTSKSDVYSFGVVLIELISSLPAVDMARHRHEINLAKLAINKIEKCAFHELIDPHLGFESDNEVKRMTKSVAELAFQCIQEDKEMRPSMDEVLEALKKIKSGNNDPEEKAYDDAGILNVPQTASPDCDEVGLLKTRQLPPPSPNDVTDNWTSRSTTPN
ncbi:leaf rust 10 disease-resistance locus receptor-like protein kinase-like 1.1, partial [Quercus suber]